MNIYFSFDRLEEIFDSNSGEDVKLYDVKGVKTSNLNYNKFKLSFKVKE